MTTLIAHKATKYRGTPIKAGQTFDVHPSHVRVFTSTRIASLAPKTSQAAPKAMSPKVSGKGKYKTRDMKPGE